MTAAMDAINTGLDVVTGVTNMVLDLLGRFGVLLFIAGFFGILFTALWFIFRYIDKRRLTLPAFIFTLFFLVFLSGNILMIAQDARTREAEAAQTEAAEQQTETAAGEAVV